jgi:putative transposase
MLKAYKYRIYPNKECSQKIDQIIETCRRLYNRLLSQRLSYNDNNYQMIWGMSDPTNHANFCWASHGMPLMKVNISRYDQQVFIKNWKKDNLYLQAVYANSLISVAIKVDNTVKAFFDRCKKKKKGLVDDVGVPRFKGRAFYNSFTYESGSGFKLIDGHLELSKIGKVRIVLHREIKGKQKTCTIKKEGNEYYAVFSCECELEQRELTGGSVGVDLGLNHFIATSDCEFEDGIKIYRESEKLISHLQKLKSNKKKGSQRYNELARIISKQHLRIKRQRLYILRNIVSRLLTKYDIICHEDLQIKNMVKNRHLSKSISDSSWGIFVNELNKKAGMIEGKSTIAVNPYNTSQACSRCGEIVKKDLGQRWHSCESCGLEIDRDVNAAINILRLGVGDDIAKEVLSVYDTVITPIDRQYDNKGQMLMFAS